MTEDELRNRAIMAAFQSGRPVFGDTTGVLKYADGDKEDVVIDEPTMTISIAGEPAGSDVSWWARLKEWLGL